MRAVYPGLARWVGVATAALLMFGALPTDPALAATPESTDRWAALWQTTFKGPGLAAALPEGPLLIGVAADDGDAQDGGAAAALRFALEALPKVATASDCPPLSRPLAMMEDAEVVVACKGGVGLVAIVRSLPNIAPTPDLDAAPQTSVMRRRPSPMAPEVIIVLVDRRARVVATVRAIAGTPLQPQDKRARLHVDAGPERYARSRFAFFGEAGTRPAWAEGLEPGFYIGQTGNRVDGPDFYRALDRPDLADAYRDQEDALEASLIGGSVVAGLGGVAAIIGGALWENDDVPAEGILAAGLLAATGGAVLALYGALSDPHPSSEGDRLEMMAESNARLRANLGLDGAIPEP